MKMIFLLLAIVCLLSGCYLPPPVYDSYTPGSGGYYGGYHHGHGGYHYGGHGGGHSGGHGGGRHR